MKKQNVAALQIFLTLNKVQATCKVQPFDKQKSYWKDLSCRSNNVLLKPFNVEAALAEKALENFKHHKPTLNVKSRVKET